jgi:hypothetical protein
MREIIDSGGKMKQLLTAWPLIQTSWLSIGAMLLVIACSSCAHTPNVFQMESRSVAKQLGLPTCRVSVPMEKSEVVEVLEHWDSIDNPEENSAWVAFTSNYQPGDQIRMLSCKTGCLYSYALIRDNKVLSEYCPLIID